MTVANIKIDKIRLKRGNTTVSTGYTGVVGEITMDTTLKTIRVHDGVTAGGTRLATQAELANAAIGNIDLSGYATTAEITAANASINSFKTYANATFSTVANAASQQTQINSINANVSAANAAITALQSNAALQASLIDTLTSNAATQGGALNDLVANAAAQAQSLTTLTANAATQANSLTDLIANAATQAQQIANVSGTYGNANVKSYLGTFDGNIIPSANVTYSLGDSTHQWKDLWVSNNTIYIGGTPVRVDGGTLLVNGAPVSGGAASSLVNGASTFQLFANGQSRSPDTIFAANGVSIINANGAIQGGIYNSGDADWFNIGASTGRGIKFYVNEETDGPQFTANGVVLPSTGVIKNITPGGGINLVSNNFAQLQWTTSTGVNEADPNQTNEPLNWLFVDNAGTWIETNKNGVVGDQQTWFFDLAGNTNVPGNVTTSGNVMTVGTANARMNFDTVNGISTMRVRQPRSWNIDNDNTGVFMYGSVGGQGQIDIGWAPNQALYISGLLSRLTEKFQQGYTDFYHEYSNIRVEIYDANNAVTTANVTNINSDYGYPPIFSITVDQVPPEEPYNLSSFNLIYDFDNVMGFDAGLGNYGISVDNENIVLRTGRDITLDAVDDFRVYAGGMFTMNYIRADGQGVDDGMLFRLTDNGSDNDTYFQFDGTIRTAANLHISPLSLYAPVSGTKIIQGADQILELISTGSFGNAQTTVGWSEAPNGTANIAAVGFNALVNGGVNITAGNLNFATASSWLFDKSGNLTLPNGTLIRDTGSVGTSGIGLGNHGFNIDFGSTVNDWAIMSGARLIQVQPDETFNIAFPEQANWQFANTGNLTFPDGTVQTTAYTGAGGGNYGDANVQALLASNVSLIGSSSTITLATLGASSTTTVSQEGGGAGYGVNTISGSASNSPGFALVQPGWTVTGNNLVGTTTVTSVTIDGFGTYTITTDTAEVDPFWYQDVYTFTSNTPSYSNLTVSSGNIINAGTTSEIQFVANSSGDGYGLSTIRLVPYTDGYDSAIIIIDPTYPNHIHIRAGGEQDNSPAQLFLGGENSYVSVDSGLDPNVYIRSNNNDWIFGTDGNLTLGKTTPHGGINRGIVWDWGLGQAALGLGAGEGSNSYIKQTENGLEIHPNEPGAMGDGDLRIRTGNVSPGGTSYDWIFNGGGGLTFPTGGNVTFDASAVSQIDGITNISATGTIGANVIQVLDSITSFGASPAPVISGFRSISTTGSAANEGNISASGNLVAGQNAYVTGNVFAAGYNFANGENILSTVISGVANAYIAIGTGAGTTAQGLGSVAIGLNAGNNTQGYYSVAVGIAAGKESQGDSTVAIGGEAGGDSQGQFAVAVGYRAGRTSQAARSIVLNATGANLNVSTTDTLTVAPVRNAAGTDGLLQYNNTTKEVTYSTTLGGNLIVTGNITQQSAYYETYANVTNSGGNLTCNFVNGGTFYATLTANVTVNFVNVALTTGTIIGATVIVDQGATPYQISNVQVNGGGIQTVKWAGGVGQNPGTGSNTDVMSFSLINLGGGAWRVLGQIANYG